MPRIAQVDHETATGKTKDLLDAVKAKLGFVPNLMSTLAVSPAALEAYLQFNTTLGGTLDAKTREIISLIVAETNGCGYCASAHTALGKMVGLSEEEILTVRKGGATDPKHRAVIDLARRLTLNHGRLTEGEYAAAVQAGLTERQITEIIANVALNIFTNTFNNVAKTTVDFPKIETVSV
ncbi:MAG: peroxidase-related enzyme [Sumerlaeia bacterium]